MARQLTMRPALNLFEVKKEGVLTQAQVGMFFGYILPIWAVHEELFSAEAVLSRWDGASDVTVDVAVALGGAEDVGDKFQLRLSWEHTTAGIPVPATSNDIDVETTLVVGRVAQYDVYKVTFIIDYDIDGVGNELQPRELLGMRLRRIAASANEVTADVIILEWLIRWQTDKMFAPDNI